jgi:hypothetical protein
VCVDVSARGDPKDNVIRFGHGELPANKNRFNFWQSQVFTVAPRPRSGAVPNPNLNLVFRRLELFSCDEHRQGAVKNARLSRNICTNLRFDGAFAPLGQDGRHPFGCLWL